MQSEMLAENKAEREAKLPSRTLRRAHARGDGPPYFLFGTRRYYELAAVLAWVAARQVNPADVQPAPEAHTGA